MSNITMINIADIINPETGKTYREENNEKTHTIPLGSLVEIVMDDTYHERKYNGLRLFVVEHQRDCDGTPLYGLSFDSTWDKYKYGKEFAHIMIASLDGGYDIDSLKVIK